MSFRQFLNTRTGFAMIATFIGGISYFLGAGLSIDADFRAKQQILTEAKIQQLVQERLERDGIVSHHSNDKPNDNDNNNKLI